MTFPAECAILYTMEERFLPIGIQDFEDLRKRGCVYVDKTDLVYKLAFEGKPYFLSRPPTFRKESFAFHHGILFPWQKGSFQGACAGNS